MPLKLLAMVRNQSESDVESAPNSTSEDPPAESPTVIFGNNFPKKGANTLRIGFQNIGGLPKNNYKRKNDLLCQGNTSHDFNIFGIAETNLDWRCLPDNQRLYFRSKEWWPDLHLSYAYNTTLPTQQAHQFGGCALFSIGSSAH
jgi:hypothetical protein